jgi:MIP family channel proteins
VLGGGANGQYLSVNLGWGLAVTMGIYVSAGISGAHLNPAVTLALAVRRGFSWAKVGPYIAAQFAGAFLASALVFITYREALDRFDGGVRQIGGALGTAGIWATYPQPFLSAFPGGIIDQVVGTALLVGVIFALSDARNFAPPERLTPVLVGLLVMLIGATFGYNAGYAINPARDLAPRLFTAIAGWGSGVFTAGNGWWWVPVVGPCIGGVLGAYVYDLVITRHHPPEAPVTPPPGRTSAGTDQQVALS